MPTTSPMLAIPLPISSDSDAVPADLLTAFTFAEKFMVGRFASAAARTAVIPTPVRGMISWVDADGWHTYYDGSIWRPFSGQMIAAPYLATNATATVATVGAAGGFTNSIALPSVPYPTRALVSYQCYANYTTPGDAADASVLIGGSTARRDRIVAPSFTGGGFFFWDIAASTAMGMQGILTKSIGTGSTVSITDPSFTWLQVVVMAQ